MSRTNNQPLASAELPILDMSDEAFWQDIYTPLNTAREAAPFARTTDGALYALRLDDVEHVLKDPRFVAADLLAMMGMGSGPVWEWWQRLMFSQSGQAHTRLRSLVSRAFTVRKIESMRPRIAAIAAELLEPAFETGGLDPMRELAHQLPAEVMSEMLGIPKADREAFKGWTTDLGLAFGAAFDPEVRARVEQALVDLEAYVHALVEARRSSPGDDLLSELLVAEEKGDRLSVHELVDLVENLMFAGHDTTRGALGVSFALLADFPEQMHLVTEDLSLVPPLVEEILRYEAITMSTARMTAVDLDCAGYRIDAGTTVGACLPSASRDPRRFDAPDTFNVRRVDVRPPTFGYGAHFCLGAALARVEMQETMRLLLTRCRAVHLESQPQWVPFAHIRRFDQLPVTLELR
jgi:cytochrome P450